jgi:hypothetical protein
LLAKCPARPAPQKPLSIEPRRFGFDPLPQGGAVNDNTADASPAALLQVLKQKLVIFASGMSRIGDLEAGAFVWKNLKSRGIGVEAGELSSNAIEAIAEAVILRKTQIFVDSGAFSEFKRSLKASSQPKRIVCDLFSDEIEKLLAQCHAVDFARVWHRYESIKATIAYFRNGDSGIEGSATPDDPDYPRPLFVMPDVVGNQSVSIDLVERYRSWILDEIEQNQSVPIIPIQVGDLTLAQAFNRIVQILKTDQWVTGLPSNEKAITPDELRDFIQRARPQRIHFLGAASSKTLEPKLQILAELGHVPDHLSADANIFRSSVYGKASTRTAFVPSSRRSTGAPPKPS